MGIPVQGPDPEGFCTIIPGVVGMVYQDSGIPGEIDRAVAGPSKAAVPVIDQGTAAVHQTGAIAVSIGSAYTQEYIPLNELVRSNSIEFIRDCFWNIVNCNMKR